MDREFLDLYNRELQLLHEHAREFSEEYPGIAERLGGLVGDRQDPMIAGLLEGAAFLAARVQLKLKHEFSEFTSNLLEQLVPNYLAPTPSALLAKIVPPYSDPALRDGNRIAQGSYIDASYRERDRRIACRYRLASAITLWPFDITGAEYVGAPGPLQAMGLPVSAEVVAGLRLSLTHRSAQRVDDEVANEAAAKDPNLWFAGCRTIDLPVHILGSEADAIALYEQIFAHCVGVYFRYFDEFGDPIVLRAPEGCLDPIGFREEEALIPSDKRLFRGFDLLREYFLFPRKFLGFRLTQLNKVMPLLPAKSVEVIFAFSEANPRLPAAVQRSMFALYAAPAVNLFERATDRVAIKTNQHEYHRTAAATWNTSRIACWRSMPISPAAATSSRCCRSIRRPPRRTGERRVASSTPYGGCRAAARRRNANTARRPTTPAPTCSSRSSSRPASTTILPSPSSASARSAPTAT
jgi:type VI secretion system protein ImpG